MKQPDKYVYRYGELTLTDKIKTNYGISFVRKYIDQNDNREYYLCKYIFKLQKQFVNLNNIVRILKVTKKYYDQEYLIDVSKLNFTKKSHVKDVRNAIRQLNDVGIIYLDLKDDNIGYSMNDNKWKIFDFDSSAIYFNNRWIIPPPYYKKNQMKLSNNPYSIDGILLSKLVGSENYRKSISY